MDIGPTSFLVVQKVVIGALRWQVEEYLTGAASPYVSLDRKTLMIVSLERVLGLIKTLALHPTGPCIGDYHLTRYDERYPM